MYMFISMKKYLLIMLIVVFGCSENGWNSDRKLALKNECFENGKSQFTDKDQLSLVCSCVLKKFTDSFSWDEYQKMLNIRITNQNSPELNTKLQVYISSVVKECEISL